VTRAAAAVLACIALAGCGSPEARIHPSLEALVPGDAVMLAGVRADALRNTKAWSERVSQLVHSALPANAAGEAGIDVRRDVDEVLAVWDGVHLVAYARGRFDGHTGERFGAGKASGIFLNETTLVIGSREDVAWVLRQRGRMQGPSGALKELMSELPGDSQVWLVAVGGRPPDVHGTLLNFAQMLWIAQNVRAAIRFGENAKLSAEITALSDRDAARLNDGLTALADLARLSAGDAAVAKAIEGVQFARNGRVVSIDAALTPEQIERLAR